MESKPDTISIMKPATYQEVGIPDAYCFESFVYVPSSNTGVCVFQKKQEPQVSRIFWRRAQQYSYTVVPVENEHYSFDSCVPSTSSDAIYYSVMHHRKHEGMKHFGGYWVSLNKFCLTSQKEEVLVIESDFIAMTGKTESWISRIMHVSPAESEIDVIAGIGDPRNEDLNVMEYAVYRIDLIRRQITHRFPMPAMFI